MAVTVACLSLAAWRAAARDRNAATAYAPGTGVGAVAGGYGAGTLNLWLSGCRASAAALWARWPGPSPRLKSSSGCAGIKGSTGLIFVPAFATSVQSGAGAVFSPASRITPMAHRRRCPGAMILATAFCAIRCSSMNPLPCWISAGGAGSAGAAAALLHAQWLLSPGSLLWRPALPVGVPQALCGAWRARSISSISFAPDFVATVIWMMGRRDERANP